MQTEPMTDEQADKVIAEVERLWLSHVAADHQTAEKWLAEDDGITKPVDRICDAAPILAAYARQLRTERDVDMHASAPTGMKCSDCSMGERPCPPCYAAGWAKRNPSIMMVACGDTELNKMRAERDAARRELEKAKKMNAYSPPAHLDYPDNCDD